MKFEIRKAERRKAKLRASFIGISGSGKTYSSLLLAKGMGGKICVIDTENRSADLYANEFEYDVLELSAPFSPLKYIDAIKSIEDAGYDIIIIDSLSHAWNAEGGILDMTDNAAKASRSQNTYTAWKETTPIHNKMLQAILQSKCHIISTMRCKTHYDMQEGANGKKMPVKVGLAPIQRDGMEYEFTVIFDIQQNHFCLASKDRTGIFKDAFIPTIETGEKMLEWLNTGKDEEEEKIRAEQLVKDEIEAHSVNLRMLMMECKNLEELKNVFIEAQKTIKSYFPLDYAQSALDQIIRFKDQIKEKLDNIESETQEEEIEPIVGRIDNC
jgi:hypothetical protein